MKTLQNSMLKKGKKGFTLTELAIVIAVIAILIAVLVPTFTSVITNARKTTAAENATQAITAYTLDKQEALADGSVIEVQSGDLYYYFVVESGTAVNVEDATYSTDTVVAALSSSNGTKTSVTSITTYTAYNGNSGTYTAATWSDSSYSATFTGTVVIYVFTASASD